MDKLSKNIRKEILMKQKEEKTKGETLEKRLGYKRRCFWEIADEQEKKQAFNLAEEYRKFLYKGKTEREVVNITKAILEENEFHSLTLKGENHNKFYRINHNKNVAIAVLGKEDISNGVNLIVAHIDSPRVDLKQQPLYEEKETKLALLHTHYYGGIKKYQWMSIPLSLHGIVIKEDGSKVEVVIGEKHDDPVFTFADLLPHLAKNEQYSKKLAEAIPAEKLRLLFGSIPFTDEKVKDKVKLNILTILEEKYGIKEEDLISAEMEIVPAFKVNDVGLDRSMIGGYGHDDRICAYSALQAILGQNNPKRTSVVFLADKEEIGSEGNTGAKSQFIKDFIYDLIKLTNKDSYDVLTKTLMNSKVLSGDVNAGVNPCFVNVHEKQNAAHIGFGVCLTKFTGSRGKSSSNDANAEFVGEIRALFNKYSVNWQTGELGKVDEGGGGTIAQFMALYGASVIDCGPPILAMHSPYEIASKADLYSTYKGYKIFLQFA